MFESRAVHFGSNRMASKDFFCCFSGASKLEDAAELYIQAGNAFKMAQKWSGKRNYLTLSLLFERFHFLITIPPC